MNSQENNYIKNERVNSVAFVITIFFLALFLVFVGPKIYFANEIKKYVAIAIILLAMIFFSFSKGVFKSYVFFSILVFNTNFAIVFMFYPQYSDVIGDAHQLMIPDIFMLLAACCFFILPHKQSNSNQISSFSTIIFFMVFLWFLFMLCIISKKYVFAMTEVIKYGRVLVVYFIFRFAFKRDSDSHNYLLYGLAFLVIVQSVIGILQQFGVDIFLRFTDTNFNYVAGSFNRVGGTLGRVRLHSLFSLVLPVFLAQAIWESKKKRKLLLTLALILGLIALALTRNRGPTISTIVGFGYVYYKLVYHRVINFNLKLIIYISFILLILAYFFSMGGKDLHEILKRPTYMGRIQQDKSVIEAIYMGKPHQLFFGFGPRQFIFDAYGLKKPFKSSTSSKNIYNVHNQYLLLLYESGIIGLLLYLAWLSSFFKSTTVLKRAYSSCKSYAEIYKIGIGGSLLSLILVSMTRAIHDNVSLTMIGVYMALLSTIHSSFQTTDQ